MGSAVLAGTAGVVGAAGYLARRLLTPERHRSDDVRILAIHSDRVVFDVTEDTVRGGRYGVWCGGGTGHLRIGEVVDVDRGRGTITRRLLGVDFGTPTPGGARWNGFYYAQRPDIALGLTSHDVCVPADIGALPGWLVPADPRDSRAAPSHASGRWAVLVHGRGGTRQEAVRAVPVLHRLGITSLLISYRNDDVAPASPDGRYNLGLSEWHDCAAAVRYALVCGAREVVLVGWSMGAAACLQMVDRSPLADAVSAVVVDSPVIDWGDVIAHHARLTDVPGPLMHLMKALMGAGWARHLVGVAEPLDVAATNWVRRSAELRHPLLIIHSVADELVPIGPSVALARRRPDLVRLETWPDAGHTREWNTDVQRWESVVAEFLGP